MVVEESVGSRGRLLAAFLFGLAAVAAGEDESGVVTCGSVVKLLNPRHGVRLHSHDVRYGSGSGSCTSEESGVGALCCCQCA